MSTDTGRIDDERIWIRKGDGSGELDGSVTLEYPQHPNVDVNWDHIDTDETEPEFDLSDGIDAEDFQAILDTVGDRKSVV